MKENHSSRNNSLVFARKRYIMYINVNYLYTTRISIFLKKAVQSIYIYIISQITSSKYKYFVKQLNKSKLMNEFYKSFSGEDTYLIKDIYLKRSHF